MDGAGVYSNGREIDSSAAERLRCGFFGDEAEEENGAHSERKNDARRLPSVPAWRPEAMPLLDTGCPSLLLCDFRASSAWTKCQSASKASSTGVKAANGSSVGLNETEVRNVAFETRRPVDVRVVIGVTWDALERERAVGASERRRKGLRGSAYSSAMGSGILYACCKGYSEM